MPTKQKAEIQSYIPQRVSKNQTSSLLSLSASEAIVATSLTAKTSAASHEITTPSSSSLSSWREILDKAWSKPTSLDKLQASRTKSDSAYTDFSSNSLVNKSNQAALNTQQEQQRQDFQTMIKAQVKKQIELRIEAQRERILGKDTSVKTSKTTQQTCTAAVPVTTEPTISIKMPATSQSENQEARKPPTSVAKKSWNDAWWNKPGASMLPGLDSPAAKIAAEAATKTALRTSNLLKTESKLPAEFSQSDTEEIDRPQHQQEQERELFTIQKEFDSCKSSNIKNENDTPPSSERSNFYTAAESGRASISLATKVPLPVSDSLTSQNYLSVQTSQTHCRAAPVSKIHHGSYCQAVLPDGRMHVVVRVRPIIEEDHRQKMLSLGVDPTSKVSPTHRAQPCVHVDMLEWSENGDAKSANQSAVRLSREFHDDRVFRFDNVLPPAASQEETYESVAKPIVDGVLRGINGTVLAYGQTGSGKTHTTFGDMALWRASPKVEEGSIYKDQLSTMDHAAGIVPRAVKDIFDHVAFVQSSSSETQQCRVYISFLEVYMEQLTDLLVLGCKDEDECENEVLQEVSIRKKMTTSKKKDKASSSKLSTYERKLLQSRRCARNKEYASMQLQQQRFRERQQQNDWGRGARKTALSADPGEAQKHYTLHINEAEKEKFGDHDGFRRDSKKEKRTERTSTNKLSIREDGRTKRVFVENLVKKRVFSPAEVLQVISEGVARRVTAETMQNGCSSRSHAILSIHLEQWDKDSKHLASNGCKDNKEASCTRSCLTIVDLAGSERVSKSGSGGVRLEEAKKINKSIAALGNCIAARAQQSARTASELAISGSSGAVKVKGKRERNKQKNAHVPFRDSPLTRLLTSTLGGNTFTALIANVGPASVHFDETFSTLLLAKRARKVKNSIRVNRKREKKIEDKVERLEREKRERRERREQRKKREQEEVRALIAKEEERKEKESQHRASLQHETMQERQRLGAEKAVLQVERGNSCLHHDLHIEREQDMSDQAVLMKAMQTPLRPSRSRGENHPSSSLISCEDNRSRPVTAAESRPVGLLWQDTASTRPSSSLTESKVHIQIQPKAVALSSARSAPVGQARVVAVARPVGRAARADPLPTEREKALVQEFSSVIQTLQEKLKSQNHKIKELEERQKRLFPSLQLISS